MKGWVIFLLAFAVYFVSIFGGFIQDDVKVIQRDSEMGKASALMATWTRPYYYMDGNEFSVYRPVTSFSFYLNAMITGKSAWGFRLGNVLIYAWVCGVVYRVLKELKKSRTQGIKNSRNQELKAGKEKVKSKSLGEVAFWGAIIFAVLPIHTEVVNNIVGRGEILSLGFLLLAVLASIGNKWELSSFWILLGMLSKETAVIGVPILLYIIFTNIKIDRREKMGAGAFIVMALIGFLLLRTVVLKGVGSGNNATVVENPLKFLPAEKRVMNAVALIPFGVSKVIFPMNLSYDYSYNQIKLVDSWLDWRVVVGLGMVILSGVYLFGLQGQSLKVVNKNPPQSPFEEKGRVLMVMGMMLFWGPILVTGNILFPIGTIFGERLWFLPSLGVVMIALAIGSILGSRFVEIPLDPPLKKGDKTHTRTLLEGLLVGVRLPQSLKRLRNDGITYIFLGILVLYGGRTVIRNFDWLSQERLFLHDVQYSKESVLAQSNAAAMYLIQRNLAVAKMKMEAADAIYPKYPELLNNWGLYYWWTGEKTIAKKKFEECLVERPGFYLCEGNLDLLKEKE